MGKIRNTYGVLVEFWFLMQDANDCKLSSFLGIDLLLLEKAIRVYTIERNEIADMVKKQLDINSKYTCVRIFSINDQITTQLSCIISKIHIGSPRIFLFHIQQFQTWSTLRSPNLCCKIKGTMNQWMLINPFISECCHLTYKILLGTLFETETHQTPLCFIQV